MTKATTQVNAYTLRKACEAYIKAREDRVAKEIEELLQSYKPIFIARLLNLKPKTREELLTYYELEIERIECRGGWNLHQVKQLCALAKAGIPGDVTITQEHAETLEDWLS